MLPPGQGCHPGEDLRDSSCQHCLFCTGTAGAAARRGGGCFGVIEGTQAQHRPVIGVGVSSRRVSTWIREFLVQGKGMWSRGTLHLPGLCHPARTPPHPLPSFVPSVKCPQNPGVAGEKRSTQANPRGARATVESYHQESPAPAGTATPQLPGPDPGGAPHPKHPELHQRESLEPEGKPCWKNRALHHRPGIAA